MNFFSGIDGLLLLNYIVFSRPYIYIYKKMDFGWCIQVLFFTHYSFRPPFFFWPMGWENGGDQTNNPQKYEHYLCKYKA